jgi:hypothetical protein
MIIKTKRKRNKKINKMTALELVEKRKSLRNGHSLYRKHIEERLFTLIGYTSVE